MNYRMVLLNLIGLGVVLAKPISRKQVAEASSAATSSSAASGGQPIPMAAVIAISAVLGTGVIILILVQVRQWRRHRQTRSANQTQDTSLQALTAEDLAGRPRTGRNAATGGAAATQPATRGRRSRRRGVRRTESGRSVKTLPEYSKEAGDEELVLVRRRSGSMSDDAFDENEEIGQESETEMVGTQTVPITIRPPSPSRSRSPPSITIEQEDRGTPEGAADIASTSVTTLQNQGWGEAPTYLEAMSALNPDDPRPEPSQVPAPRPGALQRTASGFKELLTRPFGPGSFRSPPAGQATPPSGSRSRAGSGAALLHPTISRYSTTSTLDYPSPWASSHSLLISPPVPNSAMRASFDGTSIPKGGLTKQQMRFLSSNEAVNLVGRKMEDGPPRKQRRRSDINGQLTPGGSPNARRGSEVEELPPPSWEQLDGERRMSEAYDRRNLAIPFDRNLGVEEQAIELEDDSLPSRESTALEHQSLPGESVENGDATDATSTKVTAEEAVLGSTTLSGQVAH